MAAPAHHRITLTTSHACANLMILTGGFQNVQEGSQAELPTANTGYIKRLFPLGGPSGGLAVAQSCSDWSCSAVGAITKSAAPFFA